MYLTIKTLHIGAAILTISGFLLRGCWMLAGSPRLDQKYVRVVPHIVDTVFLASGLWLVWILRIPVFGQPWLLAKLIALMFYVGFGMLALRHGRTKSTRATAFLLALLTFAYITGTALTKSVWSWFGVSG